MKINTYTCPHQHVTVTQDTGEAVIPMMIECTQCRELAVSAGYDCPQDLEPTHEWYVPAKKQRGISVEEKKKYRAHGVFLREIKKEVKSEV